MELFPSGIEQINLVNKDREIINNEKLIFSYNLNK